MIITRKKPYEELLSMLGDAKKVVLVGCKSCATSCETGGEPEMAALTEALKADGIEVVGTVYPDESCQKLLVKKELKAVRDTGYDAVVSLACGDGAQTVAQLVDTPVYPANNTMFLGQVERIGIFNEMCRMCGDCVIGYTGGICPITKCAKSLVNGPCGGQKNGKCEVNPENDCAWIMIYNRMKDIGQEQQFIDQLLEDKPHGEHAYPRTVNLKEDKKATEEAAE
ncbi:MAG: methylenetetrahydrofolate reductase C-terminal domain-containing protein [Clostridia bacterium]|nr:methylenetetrahydrofolate reductase C-terminal domain-containing protein [Clostridia bacterium]MBR6478890.1 methylenetetrahydrofolate reductase C-terminal domain-containing protein [Clostridia bacterium]MBR6512396.1 methylenetetrahydrofolate reductase C-terminal domain-containing protein [Clostridia bacterium]